MNPAVSLPSLWTLFTDFHETSVRETMIFMEKFETISSGFFMMTPQFFLNDQLKSVAHLPWRTMSYRALNNLIDHVSAVVLPMPNISPFECFRDGKSRLTNEFFDQSVFSHRFRSDLSHFVFST